MMAASSTQCEAYIGESIFEVRLSIFYDRFFLDGVKPVVTQVDEGKYIATRMNQRVQRETNSIRLSDALELLVNDLVRHIRRKQETKGRQHRNSGGMQLVALLGQQLV